MWACDLGSANQNLSGVEVGACSQAVGGWKTWPFSHRFLAPGCPGGALLLQASGFQCFLSLSDSSAICLKPMMTGAAHIQRTLAGINTQPCAQQMARSQYVVITVIRSLNTFLLTVNIQMPSHWGYIERKRIALKALTF